MEMINYTNFALDENIYGKNEIVGFFDNTGDYLEKNIYDIKNLGLNISIPALWYLTIRSPKRELTQKLLSEFGISKKLIKRPLKKLSTTERLKIELTLVLASNAKTVILDNLDVYFNDQDFTRLIKTMKAYKNEIGKTIIFTSNNPDTIVKAERYIVSNDSSIIYDDVNLHTLPIKTNTMLFADLANKKGAKLDYYKEANDLLKAIYRSVR